MIALGIFVILVGGIILQGLRYIPNNPPHNALVTVFGARTEKVKKEGLRFFLFYPFFMGYVLVNVERRPKEFSTIVRTPDNAESKLPIAYTYRIVKLRVFLDNGGHLKVEEQIEGKLTERAREWSVSPNEGPETWEELRRSGLEASATLTKAIGFNHITEIKKYAQNVPTFTWLRFFEKPRPETEITKKEKPWIEKDWAKVKAIYSSLSPEQQKELEIDVENRREEIKHLRAGLGHVLIEDLGIEIERLNLGDITVIGDVGKFADMKAKEVQQRSGEVYEVETDLMKADKLVAAAKKDGKEMTTERAYQIILEWKTAREGHGFTIPGLTPAVEAILKALFSRS